MFQVRLTVLSILLFAAASPALGQPLGVFRWQLTPFCNVISVTVTQQGGQYLLDGTDDQCGTTQPASVRGLATPNANGTIGFGLTLVTAPSALPVHVSASISLAGLSGPWTDSAGNSGTFTFTPGPAAPGSPRPAATANATLLGGQPASAYQLASQPIANATNASQLGGVAASNYLQRMGSTVLQVPVRPMAASDANTTLGTESSNGMVAIISAATTGAHTVVLPIAAPSTLFGVPMRVVSARICYSVSNAATIISSTSIRMLADTFVLANVSDPTDRSSTAIACYTVTPPTPATVEGSVYLSFTLNFNSTAHTVRFTRVEATFAP